MKLLKKITPQLVFLGIICLIGAIGYVKNEVAPAGATSEYSNTVIIDAGHGGLTNTID